MKTDLFNKWMELGEPTMKRMLALNEIAAGAMQKAAAQQLDLAREYMDLGAKQMQLVTTTKDVAKLADEEAKLAAAFGEKLNGSAKAAYELAEQTRKDYTAWLEGAVKEAATTVEQAKAA
jgi:phasin family protein